ncbi:thiolase family protein [Calditrichota bacterium GD2]
MKHLVIVDGVRTPFIKFNTLFKDLPAQRLGAFAMQALIERNHLKGHEIDEVIVGNVAQPPEAANIARNIALFAGLDERVPAFSVQRNCASGMQAVADAWYRVQAGHGRTYLAGGVESMSQIPLLFNRPAQDWFNDLFKVRRTGQKLKTLLRIRPSYFKPIIGLQLGLTDGFCGKNMGQVTEALAKEFSIDRQAQDAFALQSHQKAEQAAKKNIFQQEIVPISAPGSNQPIKADNGIRFGQTMEALSRLKPVFDSREGTITAGNASQITDGAAMLLLMEEAYALSCGYRPLARVKAFAFAALNPEQMGLGPVYSMRRLFEKSGITLKDIDLIEINEAFAAQVIANLQLAESKTLCEKYLGLNRPLGAIDLQKLNVNGGAIALGHPVGASGARLLLTLAREMKRRQAQLGLAALCVGGGQGAAFLLENVQA